MKRHRKHAVALVLALVGLGIRAQSSPVARLLVPMDQSQHNHLKAYGLAWFALSRGDDVRWLLGHRGGSFLLDSNSNIVARSRLQGVTVEPISLSGSLALLEAIESSERETVLLEKAPEIAVYTPPHKLPWDDAVTLALAYADIPYATVWDDEVLSGELDRYDWLHLHHEDFTGQLGKFHSSHGHSPWYEQERKRQNEAAARLGFETVPDLKRAVTRSIRGYVEEGGFLFAMCSATETLDVALAATKTDIADLPYDGSPPSATANEELDFLATFAFDGFTIETNAAVNSVSSIDVEQVNNPRLKKTTMDFRLFDFAPRYDPVAAMLVQNHVSRVRGFYGQTTSYRRDLIKDSVVILGDVAGTNRVRYLHGNRGAGTFTFLGGHDPEDKQHLVHDRPTDLNLHPNSPGYRLILNNVLFPAARKKKLKT